MSRVITTGWCPACCTEVIAIRLDEGKHEVCEECRSWVVPTPCTCGPEFTVWNPNPLCPEHGPRERP